MPEQETTIRDYIEILIKYRKILIGVPLATMILIGFILLIGPKRYFIDTFFRIGKIAGYASGGIEPRYIENPPSLVERLESIYKLDHVTSLSPAPIVKITFKEFNKAMLIQETKSFMAKLSDEHKIIFDSYNNKLLKDVDIFKRRISQTSQEIMILEKQSSGAQKSPLWILDGVGKSVLLSRRDELWKQKLSLNEIESLYEEKIIYPSGFIDTEVKPKYDITWAIGLLLVGFTLGLGIALIIVMNKIITSKV